MKKNKNYRMFAIALLAIAVASAATPAHAQYSVIYSFGVSGGVDGAFPTGAIAQGEDGSLYSTTGSAGANPGGGAAFKITPAGKEKLLYSFCSLSNCADGTQPRSGLTLRPDGHFLGTSLFSSQTPTQNGGTIFDISPTGSLITLHTFTGGADGATPLAGPTLGPVGQFYGVSLHFGGPTGCGTVYSLSAVFAVIHTFDRVHGCAPTSALTLGSDGNVYGTTTSGGTASQGVVFQLTYRPGKSALYTVLANFDSTTGPPIGALVEGNDGNFYGVTAGIPVNVFGSVFKVTPSGTLTILHTLNGTTEGAYPAAGLTLATDGSFYGTAGTGGVGRPGALFQITPAGSFSVLYNFGSSGGSAGFAPSNLVQHTNGLLYGVTVNGGPETDGVFACRYDFTAGCGVVYSWNGNLPAFVRTVQLMGAVGSTVEILGQGFTSTSTISFNGTAASAIVQSGTSLFATVPTGATTGSVTVTTSSGTLTSNRPFVVVP